MSWGWGETGFGPQSFQTSGPIGLRTSFCFPSSHGKVRVSTQIDLNQNIFYLGKQDEDMTVLTIQNPSDTQASASKSAPQVAGYGTVSVIRVSFSHPHLSISVFCGSSSVGSHSSGDIGDGDD